MAYKELGSYIVRVDSLTVWVTAFCRDCLYLNVIRPEGIDSSKAVPAVIWLHGGGYQQVSARQWHSLLARHCG